MGWRPGNAGTAAAVAQLVPFQLVSPKNACPRPWTERNLYPDRSPFGDRFGFVRPLLNFCVVRAKHLAQIVGTALVENLVQIVGTALVFSATKHGPDPRT